MSQHSRAREREQAPHPTTLSRTNPITNTLRRRAQRILNVHDPSIAKPVQCTDAGGSVSDTFDFSKTSVPDDDDSFKEKIEALAELICCAGDQSAAALFVLMGTLENAVDPKAAANTVKYFAFAHCADLNLYGIVDAQISVVESELFA